MRVFPFLFAMISLQCLPAADVHAETVNVGGVGSLTPLIRHLSDEFHKLRPDVDILIADPPLGSRGALRGLRAGKLDIALIGRAPQPEDAGVDMHAWIRTPLALATNRGTEAAITQADIAAIYTGERTRWSDGQALRLVMRGESETELLALRMLSPQIDAAISVALKRSGLPLAENDLDALNKLHTIRNSFGTTSLGLVMTENRPLTLLALDGVKPDLAALEAGRYTLQRVYSLATPRTRRPASADFLAFLTSPATLEHVRRFGYGALAR